MANDVCVFICVSVCRSIDLISHHLLIFFFLSSLFFLFYSCPTAISCYMTIMPGSLEGQKHISVFETTLSIQQNTLSVRISIMQPICIELLTNPCTGV